MTQMFLQLVADLPEYDNQAILKSYQNRLDRPVYEERFYLDNGNQPVSLWIYRRLEGSHYFVFSAHYGQEKYRDQFWLNSALNALDKLKTSIYDDLFQVSPSSRPIDENSITHNQELRLESELTAGQGHSLMQTLLSKHQIPLDNIHSWSFNFNGWHGDISMDGRSMQVMGEIPAAINQDYGSDTCWLRLSKGSHRGKNLTVYLKSIKYLDDLTDRQAALWAFADDVIAGKAESYLANTSTDRFDFMNRSLGKTKQPTQTPTEIAEQKARLKRRNAMVDLSQAYAGGVDVRSLLERDPRFDQAEIDQVMTEMGTEGLFFNEMVGTLAAKLETVIKPIKESNDKDQNVE